MVSEYVSRFKKAQIMLNHVCQLVNKIFVCSYDLDENNQIAGSLHQLFLLHGSTCNEILSNLLMAKSGDYVYWTCSIIVYVIGIVFAITWFVREWTKRKQIRIIKFSQHDEAPSSLEKSTQNSITTISTTTLTTISMKQLNKQTTHTKHYIEAQFHYLSLPVYFLSIMHLFFGLEKQFAIFCMFINQTITQLHF